MIFDVVAELKKRAKLRHNATGNKRILWLLKWRKLRKCLQLTLLIYDLLVQENIYEKRSKNMKHFLECNLVNPDVVSYLIMGNPVTIEL